MIWWLLVAFTLGTVVGVALTVCLVVEGGVDEFEAGFAAALRSLDGVDDD